MPISLGTAASIAGILALFGMFYLHKHGQLESKDDREDRLNKKLQGRGWKEGTFAFEIDTISINERTGLVYKLKRLLLQPLEGSSIVSLKSPHSLDEDVWDSELMDIFHDDTEVDVKYLETAPTGGYVTVLLEIKSVEFEDLMPVVLSLTKFFQLCAEEGIFTFEVR